MIPIVGDTVRANWYGDTVVEGEVVEIDSYVDHDTKAKLSPGKCLGIKEANGEVHDLCFADDITLVKAGLNRVLGR